MQIREVRTCSCGKPGTIRRYTRKTKAGKTIYYICADCQWERSQRYYRANRQEIISKIMQKRRAVQINNPNQRLMEKYA